MPAGRPPKAATLHVLQGTHQKSRHGDAKDVKDAAEAMKPDKPPRPPAHLGRIGGAEWRRVIKHLHAVGLYGNADLEHLAQYCDAYETVRKCNEELRKHNKRFPHLYNMVLNGTGSMAPHPLVLQRDRASKRMLEFGREFGMTPSSRTKLHTQMKAPKPENKFSQFKR